MCVTIFVMELECRPPAARTPPMIASESPRGKSTQQTIKPEKKSLGSGLYCRGFASRPFAIEDVTQSGFTTAFKASDAPSKSGKSIVEVTMCVTSANSIFCEAPVEDRETSLAPFELKRFASCGYIYTSEELQIVVGFTYLIDFPLGKLLALYDVEVDLGEKSGGRPPFDFHLRKISAFQQLDNADTKTVALCLPLCMQEKSQRRAVASSQRVRKGHRIGS